jgi:DNA-binding CsgD family transcriptional regulator
VSRAVSFLGRPFLQDDNRLSLQELRTVAELQTGDLAAALSAARTAVDEPAIADKPRYGWPLLAAAATAVERAAAEPDVADLRSRIAELAAGMSVQYAAYRAYSAQVAATLDGGVDRWRQAVAAWRADGQRYQLAEALLGLATAAAGAGDRAAAGEAIEEAVAVAAALGAAPLVDAADTLARRVGLRSAGHPAPSGTELLTAREQEVLRLVAEGQSNSRIAERLYISPKTASVHVSRIIAKLEVNNRVEAAAVARRLGLLSN